MTEYSEIEHLTDKDWENLCWHDNRIYGISLSYGKFHENLIIDIDYIVEWICRPDKTCSFLISPATLTFNQILDLEINIKCKHQGIYINAIHRELDKERSTLPDRLYYNWKIDCHYGSHVSFGASSFSRILRKKPILCHGQEIPFAER
ncbi:MAG: hypothetical protein A2017_05165 [Lentisphaerae bacterium GWF2_44_16]|nr:MAG: hypothetical protein A2017_05165 [Lentisphaerae bacterium GWF2_44_16]